MAGEIAGCFAGWLDSYMDGWLVNSGIASWMDV